MFQKLRIRDVSLRDAQQSLFAARLRQTQIARLLPMYKEANFSGVEVWGDAVTDVAMRFLNENPWNRVHVIKKRLGNSTALTALIYGRQLNGSSLQTPETADKFCRNAVEAGLSTVRITDPLNDFTNIKSTVSFVKQYGGTADCALLFSLDSSNKKAPWLKSIFKNGEAAQEVFTNQYFLDKATELVRLGADTITLVDEGGQITPNRTTALISMLKAQLDIPIGFHTHCSSGSGLASALAAIVAGVDELDTAIGSFAGGGSVPPIELVYVLCQKLAIELDVDMEAVAAINAELRKIRNELKMFDALGIVPAAFNPCLEKLPERIDKELEKAICAVKLGNEKDALDACRTIEYFLGFPKPNHKAMVYAVPGFVYSYVYDVLRNMKALHLLSLSLFLFPKVHCEAGHPPLVEHMGQIIGDQAVKCAASLQAGKRQYAWVSDEFVGLLRGEFGKTPRPAKPNVLQELRKEIHKKARNKAASVEQLNVVLADAGDVLLAETEEERLLLELYPEVAADFLMRVKRKLWLTKQQHATYLS